MLDKIKGWLHHMFMAKPEVKEVTPEPKKEAVVKKKPVVKPTIIRKKAK